MFKLVCKILGIPFVKHGDVQEIAVFMNSEVFGIQCGDLYALTKNKKALKILKVLFSNSAIVDRNGKIIP
jgi:hypothetical protein